MYKITLDVDGMACGMCEAHVNDAVRKAFQVKKVTSSHSKGRTEIISETELDADKLKAVIEASGYDVLDMKMNLMKRRDFRCFIEDNPSFFFRKLWKISLA